MRLGEFALQASKAAKQEDESKTLKKEKKAILFDYKGARKLNAETLINRPADLKILRRAIQAFTDTSKFRITGVKQVHGWSCPWGAKEDGMLCVGINKHGYGAWVAIRDDPELGMKDKLFLEEHRVDKKEARENGNAKSPGAVHLVRRADTLLGVLRERITEGMVELSLKKSPDAIRSRKNGISRSDKLASESASPAPRSKKFKGKTNGHTERVEVVERKKTTIKRRHGLEEEEKRTTKKKSKVIKQVVDTVDSELDSVETAKVY